MSKIENACSNRTTGKFKLAGYKSVVDNYTQEVRHNLTKDYEFLLCNLINCSIGCKWSQREIKEIFYREVCYQLTNERKQILKPAFKFREPEIDQAYQQSRRFISFASSYRGDFNA